MKLRKVFSLILSMTVALTMIFAMNLSIAAAATAPKVTGTGAILYCATTDEILWSENMDEEYNPASITKLLTCLIAIEELGLDYEVTVPYEATQVTKYESQIYEGEIITVEELVYQAMLISANDSAKCLGIAVSGSEEAFAEKMNERVREIGCMHSNFNNPVGLAANGNTSTAYDIALIAQEAFKNKDLRKIAGETKHTVPKTNKTEETELETYNLLIAGGIANTGEGSVDVDKYPGIIGGKTGTTDKGKATMVVGCEIQGLEIYAVTLNSTLSQRYNDIIHMLDFSREVINPYEVFPAGQMYDEAKIRGGATNRVTGMTENTLIINLPEGASASLVTTEAVYDEKLSAPIDEGQEIGKVNVYIAGELLRTVPLVASESIKEGWFLSGFGVTNIQTIIIFSVLFAIAATWLLLVIIRSRNIRKRNLARQEKIRQMAMEELRKQEDHERRGWTYHS